MKLSMYLVDLSGKLKCFLVLAVISFFSALSRARECMIRERGRVLNSVYCALQIIEAVYVYSFANSSIEHFHSCYFMAK